MREDDEPGLLGPVKASHSLKDVPGNDAPAPSRSPGLRHPHPDPPQVAVRAKGCPAPAGGHGLCRGTGGRGGPF